MREAGSAQWVAKELEQVAALKLEPGHLEPAWPGDDDERTDKAVRARITNQLRYSGSWPSLGWSLASDAWLSRVWDRHGAEVIERLASASQWYAQQQKVPVLVGGTLRIASGAQLRTDYVIPPTLAGWQLFLQRALDSGLKFGELAASGEYWWDRKIPRDLLVTTQAVAAK